ncbi:MAG: DoxX family protein [Terracidiphilus sp.]
MNRLDWFAQILMAALFLFAGISRIVQFGRKTRAVQTAPGWRTTEFPRGLSLVIAMLEIAGALALIVPFNMWQPGILPLLAPAGLALLTLSICIYRVSRKEPAAPVMALFLVTLFVLIGHWS